MASLLMHLHSVMCLHIASAAYVTVIEASPCEPCTNDLSFISALKDAIC